MLIAGRAKMILGVYNSLQLKGIFISCLYFTAGSNGSSSIMEAIEGFFFVCVRDQVTFIHGMKAEYHQNEKELLKGK